MIIDNDGAHAKPTSGEAQAASRLEKSAGKNNVKRHHMGKLQHNKTIVVDGPKVQAVVCGSTNFTWRGFFVQSNNAMVFRGKNAVKPFLTAFDHYWNNDKPATFGKTASAKLTKLALKGIDVHVGFSPYTTKNAMLKIDCGRHRQEDDLESVLFARFSLSDPGGRSRRHQQSHE